MNANPTLKTRDEVPLTIRFLKLKEKEEAEESLRRLSEHLCKVHGRIDHIWVSVESSKHVRGLEYEVHLEVHLPKKREAIARTDGVLETALKSAFEAMERALQPHRRRHTPNLSSM